MRSAASSGTVLIVVLWVCLGLVSLTLVFGNTMLIAFRGTDNAVAGRQADQAIEGAVRYAQFLLANTEERGQLPLPENYVWERVPVGEAWFWYLSRSPSPDSSQEQVFGLLDEASKLNLNTASQSMLEGLPTMTAELAAAIVDWRDEDDEPSEGGAETETYQLRDPSYVCKNAPFETVEELTLVNGATWEILYGEDLNRNGVLDPNENDGSRTPPDDGADGRLDPGLLELVTVYSREPNERADGSERLDVNESSEELASLFEEAFGEERASEILGRTSGGDAGSLMEYFLRSGMSSDEFDQVAGELRAGDEEELVGLVNVNTASEAVLACIPGIDEQKASELVATRSLQAVPRPSVAWAAEVLGEEAALQAGPYLTAQAWQITADVAAVGRLGRGYRREQVVIDASGETPEVIYRRRLGGLGWALGERTLRSLQEEGRRR
jgi:DNA uptake protein ComE-like DNA-binding protein